MMLAFLALLAAAPQPDCKDATAQSDMNVCSGLEAKRADAALNAAWQRLVRAKASAGLLDPQRQWLRFRDAECRAEAAAYKGGSMEPMVFTGCLADLTRERTKRLNALADDASR